MSSTVKHPLFIIAILILVVEFALLIIHAPTVGEWVRHYIWVTPLVFFKSLFKKFLLLNFFGVAKILLTVFWHTVKLLFIKFLKTIGIRYSTYFSQQKWRKTSQRLRIIGKQIDRQFRGFKSTLSRFSRLQLTLIIVAFLPLFIVLFFFGVTIRVTREAMVKKGGEIGVTNVAVKTAKKSRGLIARLRQIDNWLLRHIERLSKNQSS